MTTEMAMIITLTVLGTVIYIGIACLLYTNIFNGTIFEYLKKYTYMNMLGIVICGLLLAIVFAPIEIFIWIYRFFYWIFHIGTKE